MEESRSRRGAAAAVSKKPAAGDSAYADVFGCPPRFVAATFAARLDEYAEIFGGLAASCSIPFLDLPAAADGCDPGPLRASGGGGGFDYSEVFGSLDFGEFAAPYDELFAVPKREEARPSNGRSTEEATSSQPAMEELKLSPRHSHGGPMACQQGNGFLSNSNTSDNDSTQFNMSCNKTSQGSKKGTMTGKAHTTQLPAVPAFSFVVDKGTRFQTIGGDGSLNMLDDGIANGKHQNEVPSVTSCDNSKSSEKLLGADQRQSTNKYPASDNGHANASYHSCSSSSSISSGDASPSDIMYLTVSDVSLRTKPLRGPPPSRAPPRFSDKQGYPKPRISSSPKTGLEEVNISKPAANKEDFHVHQVDVKDEPPSFFDVEVDVSSAAAASAAAIKEAMALAQAKLKSAKEMMERKRDNLQNSKKSDHRGSMKHKEQKLGQDLIGRESFDEMLVASKKRNKFTCAEKLTPHFTGKEKEVGFTEEVGQITQGTELKSSKPVSKSEDKPEKWKTNKEYHELVNSEKYKRTEDGFVREGPMKRTKVMTMACEVSQHEATKDALTCEIGSGTKLRKDAALVACVHEENTNLESHNSHVEEVEKPGEVQKPHGQHEVKETPYAGEASSFYYSHHDKGEKSEAAVDDHDGENPFKFVEINETNKENGKSGTAKLQGEKDEKVINIANVAPEPSNGEEKLNEVSASNAQEETEIQMPHGSCISEGERIEGAYKRTDSERRTEENQLDAENVNELVEGTIAVHKQEKREELNMKQQSCLSAENELRLEIDQEAHKLEEDLKKWKSTVGATTCEEEEKLMKATKAAFWQDCNGNMGREDEAELHQMDKKEDATPVSYDLENFEGQKVYERELQVCGNEDTIEIQVKPHFMDKILSMNTVPVICKRFLNMTMDVQPVISPDKGGNVPYLSLVSMENQPVAFQKVISDFKRTEEEENERRERELEEEKMKEMIEEEQEKTRLLEEAKEMKRKLEEEKERARLLEEAKDRERKLDEESGKARLLEETRERERKLKEEKERAKLLEEAKERERKLEEEKDQSRSLEVAKERERKVEEEQARVLEEAKERERKLQEEKNRARLSEEAKEGERKLEEEKERARLLLEAKGRERKLEEEKERARLLEEEKEREREREKDRLAVERATHEAHERAFAEARERAERIAVERVTSEAWQRALKEAREKVDKASSDAVEKSLTEKASKEARIRAERAAVERATAEARERAVERALAEKAAADAREHAERCNAISRDRIRKENVIEEHLKGRDKDGLHDAPFRSIGSSSSYGASSESNDRRNENFGEGESPLRCKARLERHQRIAERAAKALAEKNKRDILAQREQAERNRLAEYLDADVKRWSNGKEGNLRALLSTLQYILGPESGWQSIPLTEVITASAVKKAYRKATLCVHPDKLQQRGASIQQKYICEKVFDLLKEAWNRFNSEER